LPVAAFSQRVAYTSDRAPNSDRINASLALGDDVASTAGRVSVSAHNEGDHATL
jgi:hypothetical protein